MAIDETGEDGGVTQVDDSGVGGDGGVRADADDPAILDDNYSGGDGAAGFAVEEALGGMTMGSAVDVAAWNTRKTKVRTANRTGRMGGSSPW